MFKVSKNARALSVTYFIYFEQVNVSFEYKSGQISARIKLEKKFCFDKIYTLMTIYILGKISQEIFH